MPCSNENGAPLFGCSFCSWVQLDALRFPTTIAAGSSGSMLGLYGERLQSRHCKCSAIPGRKDDDRDIISLQHFWVILGGIIMLFFLGCFTYIDLSGNLGGLFCGLWDFLLQL